MTRSLETLRAEPDPEDERDLDPDGFLPEDRRGEEALIPSPIPERRLLDFLGVVTFDAEVEDFVPVDLDRMCRVEEAVVADGLNMLERPSVVVPPDLKGDLETKALPVTCLKLELVRLGPPCMTPAMSSCAGDWLAGGWVGEVALEAVRVDGRLVCKGDQPLEELAMMLSRVGSNFLGVRPEWDGGLCIPAE